MTAVICILLAAIVALLWFILHYIRGAAKAIGEQNRGIMSGIESIKGEVAKRGFVTDPFKVANKKNRIGASTRNIVLRKTPDQIRNENFEKIRQGQTYGHDN